MGLKVEGDVEVLSKHRIMMREALGQAYADLLEMSVDFKTVMNHEARLDAVLRVAAGYCIAQQRGY